jgi:ADP-heptose:LPS heptosyltransferase
MATLAYHAGALGDFITVLPALRYWKRWRPGERLVLLGKPACGELVFECGVIDLWQDLDDRRYLPLFYDRFSPEAATLLGPFSEAVLFSGEDSPLVKNARASGIKLIHAQPPFPERTIHAVDYHLSLLVDPATLSMGERTPRIAVSQKAIRASRAIVPADQPFITIHSGSGSPKKNWPFERFLGVADSFRRQGCTIAWVKGPAEEGWSFPKGDKVVQERSLSVIAGLISRSRLFIGNDSGVTHLAAAVDCPTVALFGPSDTDVWAPRGDSVTVIRKKTACAPCHRIKGRENACGRECMTDICIDEVVEAISTVVRQ